MLSLYKLRSNILFNINRHLSTLSPLAIAFNSLPAKKLNWAKDECGLFNIPELRDSNGFFLLKENAIDKTESLVREAIAPDRSRKMVQVFDELSDTLCRVADLAEFVRLAHPQTKYSQAAEDACISISDVVETLNTHKPLYDALSAVVYNGDTMECTDVDKHVAKLFLFDFEQSGIHLEDSQRQKVVRLNDMILQLGQKFMAGAVRPRSVQKAVLPDNIRQYFPAEGENFLVSGLYTDSKSALAREAAYRLFLYPDSHQEDLLSNLLRCRNELARTCGFPSYAHRALNASTAENPDFVKEFLDDLSADLRPMAAKDFQAMEKMKLKDMKSDSARLASWDTSYFTALKKREWLQVEASEFTPYFSLGSCMEGVNNLVNSLYGITLENTKIEPGESWNSDIYKLSVVHENEGLLGYIYCDFFERSGKPNQDCHFTIRGGKRLSDGTYQMPVVVVMLNLSRRSPWSGPTLLTPSMVENLFHEMGHAMHSMLARTEYQHVTGTRCCTDFAEVPSVLMENFANDPRVLRTFAKHFQTQEPIPEAMLERLCASKNIFSASETQLQVFYSALDQVYHSGKSDPKATTDALRDVQEKYYGLPYVENTAWQLRFSHLVGYGAKYYSYLLSKAIASWIWHTYFAKDPLNREAGEKYRRECLAFGGGVPTRKLVANFLGREISSKNLSQSLIKDIDMNNFKIKQMSKQLNVRWDD